MFMAPVIANVECENVARKTIAVEIHSGCDLGPGKANTPGVPRNPLMSRIADVAYSQLIGEAESGCWTTYSMFDSHTSRWHAEYRYEHKYQQRQ